jgi:putative pyruvate formate lyase activating enzyme
MAYGAGVTAREFARICRALKERGAENINIVTGSHAVPVLAEYLKTAFTGPGDALPVLWNSSAYELPQTLELLSGIVDAFLPDLKTLDSGLSSRFFRAPDYPQTAKTAILKMLDMMKNRATASVAASPAGTGGGLPAVIVRHLVLPGFLESTRNVLYWFAENCAGIRGVELSLMFQYTPVPAGAAAHLPPGPPGTVSGDEYDTVLGWLSEYGIEDGYCQEPVPDSAGWLPDFEKANPFPSELSLPVWHWREGFL